MNERQISDARTDDALWLEVRVNQGTHYLAVFDPYLYQGPPSAGKIMYSTVPPFGDESLSRCKADGTVLWRTAYRKVHGEIVPVPDRELSALGAFLGLPRGTGVDAMLSQCSASQHTDLMASRGIRQDFDSPAAVRLCDELAEAYGCDPMSFRLTGGLALFGGTIETAHDVDVVVPLRTLAQARAIAKHPVPRTCRHAIEFGVRWPLRWVSKSGSLICPFFVYDELEPPIVRLTLAGHVSEETVLVEDNVYGIGNAAVYRVRGAVDLVMFRATLVRGFIGLGAELTLSAPTYRVTQGAEAGAVVALVCDPFAAVTNFVSEVLDAWSA